ncbi:matrix metalloproteinase-18-like [Antedon mediterranea]|uniref:matrix metalloproteinase-18-like n=1 Tax=Antedon mediterranea TaxID=105859 RepID=UPI003AF7D0CF
MEKMFVFILLMFHCCYALPIATHDGTGENPNIEYLKQFGWYSGGTDDIDDDVELSLKIEEFQEFAGLKVTGKFDEPTISKMQAPRCGIPDEISGNEAHSTRRRRNAFQGSAWEKRNLKYYIGNRTTDLKPSEIQDGIEYAVKLWSDNSGLTFTQVDDAAVSDVRFDFVNKIHGDQKEFDGPGKVLAHAFFPNEERRGQVHFDEAETWLGPKQYHDPSGTKYNIMVLAAHEIGHVLGLEHTSNETKSIMKPWPVKYYKNFELPSDDITSIQTLYRNSQNEMRLDLCNTSKIKFDAVLQGPQERTYFFSGIYYWEIVSSGIKQGYPKLLFELFPDVEEAKEMTGMDAIVFSSNTKKIYVFKDNQFWRFNSNFEMDKDYPKLIIETGLPDNVDSAFEQDGHIYIIKKKKVYIFDEEQQKTFKHTSTKLQHTFPGVPKGTNGALTWRNDHTYFFKKDKFYKFDKILGKVAEEYPRPIKRGWICL